MTQGFLGPDLIVSQGYIGGLVPPPPPPPPVPFVGSKPFLSTVTGQSGGYTVPVEWVGKQEPAEDYDDILLLFAVAYAMRE